MTQLIQWLNNNWLAITIPVLILLAFWVAGLWLRRIAYDAFNQWLLKTKWEGRQLVIEKTRNPFLHWFLLLGAYIAIQVSILPSEAKTMAGKVIASLFVFSLIWVAISLSEKIVKIYLPKLRSYLAKVKAPQPPTTLAVNIVRVIIVIVGVSILLGIWGAPNIWGILILAAGLIIAGLALRDAIAYRSRFMKIRKLFLNLLVIAGLGLVTWTGYLLFTHQTDTISGTVTLLLEVGFLIWIISVLRSPKYKRIKPSFKLTTFSVIAILLIFTFAGIQPLAGYKDNLIESYEVAQAERAAQMEAEEAARIAQEEAAAAARAKQEAVEAAAKAEAEAQELANAERETFRLINAERGYAGVPPIEWDDELYKLSKAHTQAMADRGGLFHSAMGASYGENAWGGTGYSRYSSSELAGAIVSSWMSSPLHRAWLLHGSLKSSAVSIVNDDRGQYASWTFWVGEAGEGPELVNKAARLWKAETGGNVPWLDWLDSKGYPYNTEWLFQ